MSDCCTNEEPVKRIEISLQPGDFWRSNSGAALPDQTNDHTEAISHNGPVAIGLLDPTTGKLLTVAGDVDIQGQIDPNSLVFSDAPTGLQTAWDSVTQGYYLLGIIGTQRPIVAVPKSDTAKVFQVRKADGTTVVFDVDTLNGRVGVNTEDPQAALDVGGAVIHRAITLADFTANGSLGTAATTVDIASVITLAQTTAGISLTLPAPTNAQGGRLLFVANGGTVQTFVAGQPIPAGTGIPFVWSGSAWIPLAGAAGLDFWRSGAAAALLIPDGVNDFTEAIAHNGNIGLGLADPSQVTARLDVSGAEVLRPVAVGNKTANGSLGTAATTVDIASVINLVQTSAGIVLTLPNPTNAQGGRVLAINNIGTVQVKVGGVYIQPGTGRTYDWSGVAWIPIGDVVDYVDVAGNRAATINDHLKTLRITANSTITVNANVFQYGIFRIRSHNGAVGTIAVGAGMTLRAPFFSSTIADGHSLIVEVVGNQVYCG